MSGIFGIVQRDGRPVDTADLQRMRDAMAHRGPDGSDDGSDIWLDGSAGLGQLMLCSTPESLNEPLPYKDPESGLVITADARIDNREELFSKLKGFSSQIDRLSQVPDSRLILEAYKRWGNACVDHLLGDFAFAIWDQRERYLFCARDCLGARPFYYFSNQNYLAFASEEEAFLGMAGVSGRPHDKFVAASLIGSDLGDLGRESWLKDIFKLPAGFRLSNRHSAREVLDCYWRLEPMDEMNLVTDLAYEEAFYSTFMEVVRSRLRVHGDPSLMLSGGIDSASIAGTAWDILGEFPEKSLKTFSIIDGRDQNCTEFPNINALVKRHESDASLQPVQDFEDGSSATDLKTAAWEFAHPISNHILLAAMMYRASAKAGNRVMFDGIEGDTITGTEFLYTRRLMKSDGWRTAWLESRQASVNHSYLRYQSSLSIFAKSVWGVCAPRTVKAVKRKIWKTTPGDRVEKSVINREYARELRVAAQLEEKHARAMAREHETEQERHSREMMQEIPWSMAGFDPVAARYGVEPAHPWADRRIVEFFLRLPLRQKVRGGWTKYLLRKTMNSRLPHPVVWHREKDHLGLELARRLVEQSGSQIEHALELTKSHCGAYVDVKLLEQLYVRCNKGHDDHEMYQLFNAVTVVLWLQRIGKLNRR